MWSFWQGGVFKIRKDEKDVEFVHDALEGDLMSSTTKVKKPTFCPKTHNKLNVQV